MHRGRTLVACALPALAVSVSWLRVESPPQIAEALGVVALALSPALVRSGWWRASAVAAATLGATWIAFGAEPWELLPYRDERVFEPVANAVGQGLADFYRVLLPFSPNASPDMHGLVLLAIFGFVLAVSLLAAASHPLGAAAVTVAGAGWSATLVDGETVALGALTLAAALSTPLILRVRSAPALVAGLAAGAVVIAGAMWASSATTVAREAALNWESWDFQKVSAEATGVRFAWDSNYDGIRFPPTKTVVLTVDGPEQARYWRTSTLDLFASDHWFEDLLWLGRIQGDSDAMPLDRLTPPRAANPDNWLEQRIEVKALVDDRLAAAGTPVALDARRLGNVFRMSGGVLRVRSPLGEGQRYRVWSYAPDPAPAVLAASEPRYPIAVSRYLELDGRQLPVWRIPRRNTIVRALLDAPANDSFAAYAALYEIAGRVTGASESPYAAVLALEVWFRQRGGFVYDEQPPAADGPPLVSFAARTRAGYCQHYAGAMAVMLRLLGIPARVAVGFTSGTRKDDKWVVTDHEAHAWVEVWFAGQGWVPFDPTPGRGTFGGTYSFASDSKAAVNALRRGDLSGVTPVFDRERPDLADRAPGGAAAAERGRSIFAFAVGFSTLLALVVGLGKTIFRRARYLTRDSRRAATASRLELEGVSPRPGHRDPGLSDAGRPAPRRMGRARPRQPLLYRCRGSGPFWPAGRRKAWRRDGSTRAPHAASPCAWRTLPLGAVARVRLATLASRRLAVVMSDTYDLFQQGRKHLRSGMNAQATVALEKAKRREPDSRSIREALGIAYFRLRRWEEAEAEFRALVELSPADDFAHYALARALVNQGKRKEATPHVKLARSLRPRPTADREALTPDLDEAS